MSQENVEVIKEFTSRFEGGDREEWRGHFDPDVVWDTSATEMPAAGVYHGHEGVERFFRDWLGTWADYEVVTPRVHRCRGRGRRWCSARVGPAGVAE